MRVVLWDLPEIMFKQKAEDRVVTPVAAPAHIGVTGRCDVPCDALRHRGFVIDGANLLQNISCDLKTGRVFMMLCVYGWHSSSQSRQAVRGLSELSHGATHESLCMLIDKHSQNETLVSFCIS